MANFVIHTTFISPESDHRTDFSKQLFLALLILVNPTTVLNFHRFTLLPTDTKHLRLIFKWSAT